MYLSITSILRYQRCPRWFFLTEPGWGLGYGPAFPPVALWIGDLVHKVLRLYYAEARPIEDAFLQVARVMVDALRANAPGGSLWEEEKQELEGSLTLARSMLRGYDAWVKSDMVDADLEFLRLEQDFYWVYDPTLAARIDGVVRRRSTGGLYVFETKTTRNADEFLTASPWDLQAQFYAWLVEEALGEPVIGVLYNLLTKADPYDVKILVNGLPSKAKAELARTTPQAYYDVLCKCVENFSEARQQVILSDYDPVLDVLEEMPGLYRRHEHLISPVQLSAVSNQVMHVAKEIARDEYFEPRRNKFGGADACPKCVMREVCLAMDAGADWMQMLELNYVKKQPRYGGEDED